MTGVQTCALPIYKEKSAIMRDLLESVQTDRLQTAYEKYLPAVLNNSTVEKSTQRVALTESRVEVTGDKTAKTAVEAQTTEVQTNVFEIRRLAGLK